MKRPVVTLPAILSDVLIAAVYDLERVEADDKYRVDMEAAFHAGSEAHPNGPPVDSPHCTVCLAGAIMAKRLGFDATKTCWPADDPITSNVFMLHAVDYARMGAWLQALQCVNSARTAMMINGYVHEMISEDLMSRVRACLQPLPVYEHDPQTFRTKVRGAAKTLREYNL